MRRRLEKRICSIDKKLFMLERDEMIVGLTLDNISVKEISKTMGVAYTTCIASFKKSVTNAMSILERCFYNSGFGSVNNDRKFALNSRYLPYYKFCLNAYFKEETQRLKDAKSDVDRKLQDIENTERLNKYV